MITMLVISNFCLIAAHILLVIRLRRMARRLFKNP
jgi:hypothetical protein